MQENKVMENSKFISKVWDKVEELELIELEKKEIEKNRRIILKEKIKNISLLSITFIFMCALIEFNIMDKESIAKCAAVILLIAGNIIHNKVNEIKIENRKAIKREKWGESYGN